MDDPSVKALIYDSVCDGELIDYDQLLTDEDREDLERFIDKHKMSEEDVNEMFESMRSEFARAMRNLSRSEVEHVSDR